MEVYVFMSFKKLSQGVSNGKLSSCQAAFGTVVLHVEVRGVGGNGREFNIIFSLHFTRPQFPVFSGENRCDG